MEDPPTYRTRISRACREKVIQRQNGKCAGRCNTDLEVRIVQIDHIVPWSVSHNNGDENLQALCPNCHAHKTVDETPRLKVFRALKSSVPAEHRRCWFCAEATPTDEPHASVCTWARRGELKSVSHFISPRKMRQIETTFCRLLQKCKDHPWN